MGPSDPWWTQVIATAGAVYLGQAFRRWVETPPKPKRPFYPWQPASIANEPNAPPVPIEMMDGTPYLLPKQHPPDKASGPGRR